MAKSIQALRGIMITGEESQSEKFLKEFERALFPDHHTSGIVTSVTITGLKVLNPTSGEVPICRLFHKWIETERRRLNQLETIVIGGARRCDEHLSLFTMLNSATFIHLEPFDDGKKVHVPIHMYKHMDRNPLGWSVSIDATQPVSTQLVHALHHIRKQEKPPVCLHRVSKALERLTPSMQRV